jgi:hypothetical protein
VAVLLGKGLAASSLDEFRKNPVENLPDVTCDFEIGDFEILAVLGTSHS